MKDRIHGFWLFVTRNLPEDLREMTIPKKLAAMLMLVRLLFWMAILLAFSKITGYENGEP
jgi:hypothetical protein